MASWAFTITTNKKRYNKDKDLFHKYVLSYFHWKGLNIDNLDYTIEEGKTMGYHIHGYLKSGNRWDNIKKSDIDNIIYDYSDLYVYWVPIDDLDGWRDYIYKDIEPKIIDIYDYKIIDSE